MLELAYLSTYSLGVICVWVGGLLATGLVLRLHWYEDRSFIKEGLYAPTHPVEVPPRKDPLAEFIGKSLYDEFYDPLADLRSMSPANRSYAVAYICAATRRSE